MDGDPLIGRVLGATYRLDRRLGRGGMGAVYEAVHGRTGRRYAVKVLLPELAASPDGLRRFQREARAASALGHVGIVAVHDFDVAEDGTAYIVMDLLEGENLAVRIDAAGALPWPVAARIFDEVASALEAAHAARIVHRDLKPANVFLATTPGAPERAVLLDFGLAKMVGAAFTTKITTSGVVMGTPQYMSPEQAQGEEVGPGSDLYALATMLFEMVSGQVPFAASTPAAFFARLLTAPPPSIDELVGARVPVGLDAVLTRALAKQPSVRYPDARSLRVAVRALGTEVALAGGGPPGGPSAGAVSPLAATEATPLRPALPWQTGPSSPSPGAARGTGAARPVDGLAPTRRSAPLADRAGRAAPSGAADPLAPTGPSAPIPTLASQLAPSAPGVPRPARGGRGLLVALAAALVAALAAAVGTAALVVPPMLRSASSAAARAAARDLGPATPELPAVRSALPVPQPGAAGPDAGQQDAGRGEAAAGAAAGRREADAGPRRANRTRPAAPPASPAPPGPPPSAPPSPGAPPSAGSPGMERAFERQGVGDYRGCLDALRAEPPTVRVLSLRMSCAQFAGDRDELRRTCRELRDRHPESLHTRTCEQLASVP